MNVYALSRGKQRLLATSLLLAALAATFFLIVQPVANAFSTQQTRIDKAQSNLVKWQGVIASESDIVAAAAVINRDERLERGTLRASSDTQAAAGLQSLVRKALLNAGADVRSSQILPADEAGEMRMVGVRVVYMANSEQLERAIMSVENSMPYLFVREADIQISASSRRATSAGEAPELQVRMDIFAFARTGE
ncbi:MAG: type II secretion system protein GspM [Henriciella sp.]|uniref:type II secretion system protein GspM n=1 Tax=Henriciella sp. TaxID=1968823 RepID=UPI003C734208